MITILRSAIWLSMLVCGLATAAPSHSPVEYVFVGLGIDFIGATFKDTPEKLVEKVKAAMGIDYKPSGSERWVSTSYGVLITYHDRTTPSKMYCFGYPHTPL